MRLEELTITGMKRGNATYEMGDVTLFLGPNGSGKSCALQAIYLAAVGWAPGVPRNSDGVMRLASSPRGPMSVAGRWSQPGSTEKLYVERIWRRDRKGKVTCEVNQNILVPGAGDTSGVTQVEARRAILGTLGSIPEVWSPDSFLALSTAKMRDRVLRALPHEQQSLDQWVSPNLPENLKPRASETAVDPWIRRALSEIAGDLQELEREHRRRSEDREELEFSARQPNREAVGDAPTLHARLNALRDERDGTAAYLTSQENLERQEAEVVRMREALAEPPLTAAEAREKLKELDLDTEALAESQAHQAALAAAWAELGAATDGEEINVDAEAAASAVSEALDRVDALSREAEVAAEEVDKARRASSALSTRLEAASPEGMVFESCPKCEHDLVQEASTVRASIGREFAQAVGETEAAHGRLEGIRDALRRARVDLGECERVQRALRLRAEVEEIEERGKDLPDAKILMERAAEARSAIDKAKRWEEDKAALGERETDLEIARAEHAALDNPTRDLTAIDEESSAIERKLSDAGALAHVKTALSTCGERLAEIERGIDDLKGHKEDLLGLQSRLLREVRAPLERAIAVATGKRCDLKLIDDRGADTCRIMVDGVDVSTISDGERIRFAPGVAAALLQCEEPQWRFLPVDRLESVSQDVRGGFLRTLETLVTENMVHQVVVCGCPDDVAVDAMSKGVVVHRL